MRMWMVAPKYMCRKHLLGEHVETHMFVGCLHRGIRLDGYVDSNCLELTSLRDRHDELAREMEARGYGHWSPIDCFSMSGQSKKVRLSEVNKEASWQLLSERCSLCRKRREDADVGV